jgi:hypothetical protein
MEVEQLFVGFCRPGELDEFFSFWFFPNAISFSLVFEFLQIDYFIHVIPI